MLSPEQMSSVVSILVGMFAIGVALVKEIEKREGQKPKPNTDEYAGECWGLVKYLSATVREQHQDLLMLREANNMLAKQLVEREYNASSTK